jgi:hypothetical protein
MLILALWLPLVTDTIRVRPVGQPPAIQNAADLEALGPPAFPTAAGLSVWLLGDSGSVYLVIRMADSTPAWNDRLVLTLDTDGDRDGTPQHDDFEWDFHRIMDSSVIFRGRGGHWQPPRDDPDWRLGRAREGGGWMVREKEILQGWLLIVTLDGEYFRQRKRAAGLGVASYDESVRNWVTWPAASALREAGALLDHPNLWGTVVQ